MDICRENMSDDEYFAYLLETEKEYEKEEQYNYEIRIEAASIIDKKRYDDLFNILKAFDKRTKESLKSAGLPVVEDLPFWCCPFGRKEN